MRGLRGDSSSRSSNRTLRPGRRKTRGEMAAPDLGENRGERGEPPFLGDDVEVPSAPEPRSPGPRGPTAAWPVWGSTFPTPSDCTSLDPMMLYTF